MQNRFRLCRTDYEREKEEQKIEPQKIFFLSVEGNVTEREYFEGISKYREQLGINGRVNVEVLYRSSKDTNSAPKYVLELLEEFLRLKELGRESMIEEILEEYVQKYGEIFIQTYLENPEEIPKKERNRFVNDLKKAGYDINYRKYLSIISNDNDKFGILIDRDAHTHSEKEIYECMEHCRAKGYHYYMSNPCFEFWLLLHLSDVKEEYRDRMADILENRKISKRHTFVSKEVSDKAHHNKYHINFQKNYLPHIFTAAERAKRFAENEEQLVGHIGCNLWKLIDELKAF